MKYDSLNTLKGIACIGVVVLHCRFPGETGKAISYLFKFAVPCFFMISGYFLYANDANKVRERCLRRFTKNLKLLLWATVLYAGIDIFRLANEGSFSLLNWLTTNFSLPELLPKIFLGSFFNGTMWYLHALLWSYICIYLLSKIAKLQRLHWLAFALLFLHLIVRLYARTQGFEWFTPKYFSNFAGFGVPFILIGYTLAAHYEKLNTFKDSQLLGLAAIGFVMQYAEYYVFKQPMDIFLGSILFSIGLFAFALKHPTQKFSQSLNYIGEELSLTIYIEHIAVLWLMGLFITFDSVWLQWIHPIVAVLICILVAIVWKKIKAK